MADVVQVAEHILHRLGPMSAMKLQKLVYYSQAWHMVWQERLLFDEHIEAWANGPVCPALYTRHRGQFLLEPGQLGGTPRPLDAEEEDSLTRVLNFYGHKDPQWLSELTHREAPWQEARAGLQPHERGNQRIKPEQMMEFYSSLV